ncbi:serine/threonine-protein kinase [Corallococcus sp. AS-1-6]|uniref:serine/threonine protein kinase n=1 Tax=Corallococcus sp. AS-1-6 TaxID=2874599 RepID=UPI001CBD6F27|nr:serine/threonine-protein kinase [Corallococcus sp. AS-1-6]MBZ4370220.1 serine/threonine protein kinase [Corallococcus sp. AS-1-6]
MNNLIDGRYSPISLLGQGGFGHVYLMEDVVTGSRVALKMLANASVDAVERFRREARILNAIAGNMHVVQILMFNMAHSPPYIVTEYCEGGSLRTWVGNRNWKMTAGAIAHACVGLSVLHSAGGFHRDLKPDNMLVSPVGGGGVLIKLADFGLARRPLMSDSPMTRHGAGTNGYIAPEVLAGAEYQSSADVYSLGIVAAELLTGERSARLLNDVQMPAKMRALILDMLSQVPTARPTAAAVAASLNLLLTSPPPAVQSSDSGMSGLWAGGLLVGGLLLALAAFSGGTGGGAGGGGGGAGGGGGGA